MRASITSRSRKTTFHLSFSFRELDRTIFSQRNGVTLQFVELALRMTRDPRSTVGRSCRTPCHGTDSPLPDNVKQIPATRAKQSVMLTRLSPQRLVFEISAERWTC